jgi:fermentation-respiration switch protein FrsA (DUF1100 family)
MRDVAWYHFGPLALVVGHQFDSVARLRNLPVPIFIAHGDRDTIVPFDLGKRLYAAAKRPKRFFRAAGAQHNDVFASPGLIDAIAEFAHATTARQRPA